MKISKLFHWLYASLCFLPLLVAPIFALAVRSDNNYQPIEIDYQYNKVVPFNQLINNERVTSNTNVTTYTYDSTNNSYTIDNFSVASPWTSGLRVNFGLIENHKYIVTVKSDTTFDLYTELSGRLVFTRYETQRAVLFTCGSSQTAGIIGTNSQTGTYTIYDLMLIDLTSVFGSGNEPSTYAQYYNYFGDNYYNFTLDTNFVINDYVVTLNDTDVGSQYLYSLYNVTDKYMDFGNVFNLYQVNEWINANVFNGSVPLVWTIIWHYLDYWLLLSIFWLCFDVLIYVPQLAHRWLDKAALE